MYSASRRSANGSKKRRRPISMRQNQNQNNAFANLRLQIQKGRNQKSRENQSPQPYTYTAKKNPKNIQARNVRLKQAHKLKTEKLLNYFKQRVENRGHARH
jgi:hypothetical protein